MGIDSHPESEDLLAEAAVQLVEASAVEMVSEAGALVEVWTISCQGPRVRASAPRLQVARELRLTSRLVINEVPHRVSVVVDDAVVHSQSRAALTLCVVEATPDSFERSSERVELAVQATLTALICGRVVPGESIPVQIVDLSQTGFAATVADSRLRAGDRVRIYCRFLEGELDCEARIKTVIPTENSQNRLGCMFLAPPAIVEGVTTRVLARLNHTPNRDHTTINMRQALNFPDATAPPTTKRRGITSAITDWASPMPRPTG